MSPAEQRQQMYTDVDNNLTAMDKYLGQATERMGVADYPAAQVNISAAHKQLGAAGKTLAALHDDEFASAPPSGEIIQYPEPTEVVVVPMGWGASVRGLVADSRKITAMEFTADKDGEVSLDVSQFQSVATTRQACLVEAGGAFAYQSQGNTATGSAHVTQGKRYWLMFRCWATGGPGELTGPTANAETLTVAVEGRWP